MYRKYNKHFVFSCAENFAENTGFNWTVFFIFALKKQSISNNVMIQFQIETIQNKVYMCVKFICLILPL